MSTGNNSPSKRIRDFAYLGPGPEAGPLPALFYFALSAEESLELDPYNQPALALEGAPFRIFSVTLPCHGPGFDKHRAMHAWAEAMKSGERFLEDFFDKTVQGIDWLIENLWVDPSHLAAMGLSRGGFVATHIAAREKRIKTLLGFAPLTKLSGVHEFAREEASSRAMILSKTLDLTYLVDSLTHLHSLRFYIGNRDTRVSTDACFHFIRKLADKGHEVRARHMNVEMMITRSLGYEGHGTAPHIFQEGARWMKEKLL